MATGAARATVTRQGEEPWHRRSTCRRAQLYATPAARRSTLHRAFQRVSCTSPCRPGWRARAPAPGHRLLPCHHRAAMGVQAGHGPAHGSIRLSTDGQSPPMGARCPVRARPEPSQPGCDPGSHGADRPVDGARRHHQFVYGHPGRRRGRHGDRPRARVGAWPDQCVHELRQGHRVGGDRRPLWNASRQVRPGRYRSGRRGRRGPRPDRFLLRSGA